MTFNLKTAEGREILRKLIARDIFGQNFRPDAKERAKAVPKGLRWQLVEFWSGTRHL